MCEAKRKRREGKERKGRMGYVEGGRDIGGGRAKRRRRKAEKRKDNIEDEEEGRGFRVFTIKHLSPSDGFKTVMNTLIA